MDDNIIITNIQKAYALVSDSINDLDNKSFQMLSIIGVMFTLQVSLLLPLINNEHVFLLSLVCYFISALSFLKVCLLKDYALYPTGDSEVHHYVYDVSFDEYVTGALGDYREAIKNNLNVVNSKSKFVSIGYYLFIIGLFLTLVTVICVVL